MLTKSRIVFTGVLLVLILCGASLIVGFTERTFAAPLEAPMGKSFTYQGFITDGGSPANGSYDLAFSLYDNISAGSQVGSTVIKTSVAVTNGYFTVELDFGDVFDGTALWMEIEVQGPGDPDFTPLLPRQPVSATPYASYASAAPWSGLSGVPAGFADGVDGVEYGGLVIVAKSGGDYSSVQSAIDSIVDAASDNPYQVWVAPGEYSEIVTMKPYVHLQGADQGITVITSTSSNGSFPPTQATVVLASDVSLRDLTVENNGVGSRNVALLASGSVTRSTVTDVSVRAQGSGSYNYAVFLGGSGTDVTFQQVTALSENGSSENYGLYNNDGAAAGLFGGFFTGSGGNNAYGIYNSSSNTTLRGTSVTALGESGSDGNYGLFNNGEAAVTLFGSIFTGRGGSFAYGINNTSTSTTLKGTSVTALGESGSTSNYGLYNFAGGEAMLHGGSFSGIGGSNAYGIWNSHSGSILEMESAIALGENGSTSNYGLSNYNSAVATLRGGSFTGSGGTNAYGIYNDDWSTLETEGVTALGENGSSVNLGLYNYYGAMATLRGGSFAAYGGINAYGIYNNGSSTTLKATNATALGEGGSGTNYGLYQDSGTVSLGVMQLVGGLNKLGGSLTCFQAYDGSFAAYSCP
jgi:hypothetical protein